MECFKITPSINEQIENPSKSVKKWTQRCRLEICNKLSG